MTLTKNCEAQKNLEALMKEGVISGSMGSSDLKRISDVRIAAILKHSDQVVNRKINITRNELGIFQYYNLISKLY